ncbi:MULTISPECIES: hypothetical protein [unclassified Caballeronia]|uniref:hypothetical protein n=1 Tax=unclassified Caballeronia TaxID=2646786 RepID=UPI00285E92F5|nr:MULTISPECIES: hypothetical protein [unclassified Caballeronia]MDR5777167.1 hypothetical protein [Caballeronia sp. LZ002]MDR5852608.1 hypothetical protein [Caballeronia sp. LZ003]
MKTYPFISFVSRHGRRASLWLSLALALVAIILGVLSPFQLQAVCVLLASAVLYALLRLLAELIEVIVDTLMPH